MTNAKTDAALLLTLGTVSGLCAMALLRFGSNSASVDAAVIVLICFRRFC